MGTRAIRNRNVVSLLNYKIKAEKGTTVYELLKKIKVLKKAPVKAPTLLQAAQRQKFGLAAVFAVKLKEMIQVGFYGKRKKIGCCNYSTRQIYKNAIIGEYPNFHIDYAKVILSEGCTRQNYGYELKISDQGNLDLTWDLDRYVSMLTGDDSVFLFVYNATQDLSFSFQNACLRHELSLKVQIPVFNNGDKIHCWVFLKSNNNNVSRSVYLVE